MAASDDDEYVQNASDDEDIREEASRGGQYGTRSTERVRGKDASNQGRTRERWEDIQRSWDLVTEGADGSLTGTVEGLLEAGKRRRLLRDTTPLQRGIIRHLILVLDMSSAMAEKDLRPTRYLLTLRYAQEFVTEFFEQNPISQMAIIGMRGGLAIRISEMGGNPSDHISELQKLYTEDPKGNPSLQNALDMARAALFHTPSHGTREVLIIFGALLSSDPGDIHVTIRSLVMDKIRVSVVGLAARIAICQELCAKTNGTTAEDTSVYGVAMHEQHFRELLLATTIPPVTRASAKQSAASLLMMGFPSRMTEEHPTLCACHSNPTRGGYLCSRCKAKVCSLPTVCPTCDLTLILSTHLARSYHHLFPLNNYSEVTWREARHKESVQCFSCLVPFPPVPDLDGMTNIHEGNFRNDIRIGASESSRYACATCGEHFCIDCDLFAHEVVHNCAGCQSKARELLENGVSRNNESNGHTNDMEVG